MHRPYAGLLVLAALTLGTLLGGARPAVAQVLSKWGHPVFTFGWTPYDSINAGHGNVTGVPGFIPGYGCYPSSGEDRYPWMDGPGTPFDRRTIAGMDEHRIEPLAEEQVPPGAAVIIVKVPAE